MGQLKVSDNASTTLAASLTSSPAVTSMTLTDASKFPVINNAGAGSDWTWLTLFDSNNLFEIVKVTRRDNATNTLTIVRGTAMGLSGYTDADCKAWASTTTGVACRMIAGAFNDIAGAAASATASAAAAAASVAPLASVSGLVKGNGAGGYSAAVANTDYTRFAAGTKLVFAQAAAPTGWTQVVDDSATNRMLRVVNSPGAGTGGTHSPVLNNVVPAHTHGFTTGNQSADHTHHTQTGNESVDHGHGIGDPGHSHSFSLPVGAGGGGTWGSSNVYHQGDVGYGTAGSGTGIWTGGRNAAHYHAGWSGGVSANHTHSGTTDNGSSSTNWQPRYLDTIVCSKD